MKTKGKVSSNNYKGAKKLAKRINKIAREEAIASAFKFYVDNSKISRRLKIPVPDGLRTTLRTEWMATEAIMAPATNNFQIWANSPQLPLNITNYAIAGNSLQAPVGTSQGEAGFTVVNKQPAGLVKLLNGSGNTMYDSVSVIGSTIKVHYYPEALADAMEVCIVLQRIVDARLITTTGRGDELPYSKRKLIQQGGGSMCVTNHVNLAKFQGQSARDYMCDYNNNTTSVNGAVLTPATSYALCWNVIRQSLNGAVTSAPLPYKVEVEYDCVFKKVGTGDLQY